MPNQLIEYIKLHKLSLEQDYDRLPDGDDQGVIYLNGQICALNHILDYAQDLTSPLRKE